MFSVIVVPVGCRGPEGQHRLEPGQTLRFGRTEPADAGLAIPHPEVPCSAGEITATGAFWILTNFSRDRTYVVADPEGDGDHISVGPGRADAPVPFEFARVTLTGGNGGNGWNGGNGRDGWDGGHPALSHPDHPGFDVLAPRHDYLGYPDLPSAPAGDPFPVPFPLDHSRHYFLVLAALCEPRLRGAPDAPPPTDGELTARLRTAWPDVTAADIAWNLDYLGVKLRLKPPPARLNGGREVRESLVTLALRFDLVREEHLACLDGQMV